MANEATSLTDEMQDSIKNLLADRLLLAKMEAAEKTALLSSRLLISMLAGGLGLFVLLFFSLMAGYYFGQLFGSLFAGFATVAGIYLLLLVLLLTVWRRPLQRRIENTVIRTIFAADDSETSSTRL
ncbi:MAG: phage holin family protein [Chitinophagaceae bacterium]|jgi:hypothetical protein|nr:phage holin family protein [Chitinophagaceae bacterium]